MIDKIKEYLDTLNERERKLVIIASIFVLVFIPYQFIWKPVTNSVTNLEVKVEKKQKDLLWMQGKIPEIRSLSSKTVTGSTKSIYGIVERSAQSQFGQSVAIQQSGETGVKIKITNGSFDDMLTWLDGLILRHNVIIKDIQIKIEDQPGKVTASVILET